MASNGHSQSFNGNQNSARFDWLVDELTKNPTGFPCDRQFNNPRRIFVNEPKTEEYLAMGRLLKQRSEEISDLTTDNYILTYASDSKILIRTFVSKNIFNGSKTGDYREPPLSYSTVDNNAEILKTETGQRQFDVIITKYGFRKWHDDIGGPWLALIVEEGTVERHSDTFHEQLVDFAKLYLEIEAVFNQMKTVHADASKNWEIGSKAAKVNIFQSPTKRRQSPELSNGSESGAGTSQMLSALLRANGESERASNIDYSYATTIDLTSTQGDTVQVRDIRIQTNSKLTGWFSSVSLQDAARMDYRSTTVVLDGDREIVHTYNEFDGIAVEATRTKLRQDEDSVECIGSVPAEEPSTSKKNQKRQREKLSPAAGSKNQSPSTNKKNKARPKETETTSPKKKRDRYETALHSSLQDFVLPTYLKKKCIDVLIEKD